MKWLFEDSGLKCEADCDRALWTCALLFFLDEWKIYFLFFEIIHRWKHLIHISWTKKINMMEDGTTNSCFSAGLCPFYTCTCDFKKQKQRNCSKLTCPSYLIRPTCISLYKQDSPLCSAHIWNSVFRSCNDTLRAASWSSCDPSGPRARRLSEGRLWLNHNHSFCPGEVGVGCLDQVIWVLERFGLATATSVFEQGTEGGRWGEVNTEPGVKGRQSLKRRDSIAEKRRRESGTEFCSPWGSRPASSSCWLCCVQVTGPVWLIDGMCFNQHFDGFYLFIYFLLDVCVVQLVLLLSVVSSGGFVWWVVQRCL